MSEHLTRSEVLGLLIRLTIAGATTALVVYYAFDLMDPTRTEKRKAKKKSQELLEQSGIKKGISLTEYEHMIASQLVLSSNLKKTWRDIAGLQPIIREIFETVILPVQQSQHCKSNLIKPPKGVLLHGPPGCGKTLLAQAVAKEAGCRFINLDISVLTDKWYGESQKLASAVFSLATKIQPCIIFIDEVDSFLKVRSSGDHEATSMMKAMFLQQWDGLNTDENANVIVMAATNRPYDVDRAILRRLPSSFHIKLPEKPQREEILRLILRDENVSPCVDFAVLANKTDTFSGAELKELCRTAAVYGLRSVFKSKYDCLDEDEFHDSSPNPPEQPNTAELPPITMAVMMKSLKVMRSSRLLDLSTSELLSIEVE